MTRLTCNPREFADFEILAGETGYFGAQAEPDQMDFRQRKPSGHQVLDELGQVSGGHARVRDRVAVPRERAHRAPVHDHDVHSAPVQVRCGQSLRFTVVRKSGGRTPIAVHPRTRGYPLTFFYGRRALGVPLLRKPVHVDHGGHVPHHVGAVQ